MIRPSEDFIRKALDIMTTVGRASWKVVYEHPEPQSTKTQVEPKWSD